MRAADATPPSRRPRSLRPFLQSLVSLVLLVALITTALPTHRLTSAQPEPPTGTITMPANDATEPSPTPNLLGDALETAPAVTETPPVAGDTGAQAPDIADPPLPSEPTEPLLPTSTIPAEPITTLSPAEPEGAGGAPAQPAPDSPTAPGDPDVSIANASLPVACQLVLAVSAVVPGPGASVGDRLPDPISGAVFGVSVEGRGTFNLLTDASGALNLVTQGFADNGLPITAGDTVTVSQLSTRTGLTLGDPAFVATFAWQSAFAPGCRVAAFVINPAVAAPPSSVASVEVSPSQPETASAPASPSTGAEATSVPVSPSPGASPSPASSVIPSPSDPPASASPTPSPIVTSTTAPTATTAPTIPAGFGRIEVWAVASRAPDSPTGQVQARLPGARFIVVERQNRRLVATLTTGSDGTVQSPLLPLGTYDLVLDAPPPRYFTADARGFSVSSPTVQLFVFALTADPNPPAISTATIAPAPSSPGASASPRVPPTATTRSVRPPRGTTTPSATATNRSMATATATAGPTATRAAGTPTETAIATATSPGRVTRPPRGTTSPGGTATPRPATATPRPTTATPRPVTSTPRSATATPRPATSTPQPATVVPTLRPTTVATVTSTPFPRGTRPAATATRAATPRPGVTSPAATSTPVQTSRATATAPTSPTQPDPNKQSRVTVEVVICIDARFIAFGEFGSVTDLGPRYLTDIDRSRCRPARAGEVRVSLTGAQTVYSPAIAQTGSSDATSRMTFVVANTRDRRSATLHLEGPVPALDARLLLIPGLNLTIPLTVVVQDPAAPPIGGATTGAASGPAVTGGPIGWSAIPTTLGLLLLVAFAVRRLARTIPARVARRAGPIR